MGAPGEGPLRVAVVGPGALGCLVATLLRRGGARVWLVDHRPERARRLDAEGLTVERPDEGPVEVDVRCTADPGEATDARVLVYCPKSHQLEEALAHTAELLGGDRWAVGLQNGLDHPETMAGAHPRGRVLGGTTDLGARRLGEGRVRWAGGEGVRIGPLEEERAPDADRLARRLEAHGLPARTGRLVDLLWAKACTSAAVNGLSGVVGVPNGLLATDPDLAAIVRDLAAETARVARAVGASLDGDPGDEALAVCRRTATNRSSLLEDLEAGRPTEIEALNGAVRRHGRDAGVETPRNETIHRLIRALARRRTRPEDAREDPLV